MSYLKCLSRLPLLTTIAILCNLPAAARAAEPVKETSVLNLVPRDAAAFVHIRVADFWKHNSLKPVRDFLTKTDPSLLKEFEKSLGFLPADIDTVTLIFPQFSARDLFDAPVIVVRATQPFDKAKVLRVLRVENPGQFERAEGFNQNVPRTATKEEVRPPEFKIEPKTVPPPAVPDPKPFTEKFSICDPKEDEPVETDDPFGKPMSKPDIRGRHYFSSHNSMHLFVIDDRTLAFGFGGQRPGNDSLLAYCVQLLRRADKGPLDGALAEAAKKRTVVAALAIEQMVNAAGEPPAKFDKYRSLLAAKSAMLTLDLADDLQAALTIEGGTAEQAKKIEDSLHALIGEAKAAIPDLRKDAKKRPTAELLLVLLDQGEKALAKIVVEQKDTSVRVSTSITPDVAFEAALKAAMAQVTVARERMISINNLKQMGIAIHGYHDAMGRLPFPGVGRNGAPLGQGNMNPNLSWRVAILPYVEQANLYQQFKLDEPWDSEHNKALIPKMPKIYAPVNGVKAEKGHTFYQIFTGREAFRSGFTLQAVTDGLSNTLMVVESGDAVPWTRPEDMLYDSKKPVAKLGALFNGDFNALFGDGSVRFIRKSIPEKTLRALITPQGGEVVEDWDN